jgi:hypothetical protein
MRYRTFINGPLEVAVLDLLSLPAGCRLFLDYFRVRATTLPCTRKGSKTAPSRFWSTFLHFLALHPTTRSYLNSTVISQDFAPYPVIWRY